LLGSAFDIAWPSMTLRIDLKSAILALSDALDLVGVNDFQHGKRVAMIARETGLMLGLPEKRLDRLVCASLLHDLGRVVYRRAPPAATRSRLG
jgi:HD-GYP domain-containing protein (c-di-GMP phosphodiesterase class II)